MNNFCPGGCGANFDMIGSYCKCTPEQREAGRRIILDNAFKTNDKMNEANAKLIATNEKLLETNRSLHETVDRLIKINERYESVLMAFYTLLERQGK